MSERYVFSPRGARVHPDWREALQDHMELLDEREPREIVRQSVRMRFGLNGESPMTLDDIGASFARPRPKGAWGWEHNGSMTGSRIAQLIAIAVGRIHPGLAKCPAARSPLSILRTEADQRADGIEHLCLSIATGQQIASDRWIEDVLLANVGPYLHLVAASLRRRDFEEHGEHLAQLVEDVCAGVAA